ncbi:MAG: hypothetical protein ACRD3T_20695 [Terriglobia bacterium]
MTTEKRRVVAYLAAWMVSNKHPNGVYDQTTSSWTPFTTFATPNHLSVYDHDRSSMVSVNGPPGDLYIYDCKSGRHIQLKITGGNLSGYDFEAMAFFSGTVSGSSIFFCDFQHSDYFKYSTEPPPGQAFSR